MQPNKLDISLRILLVGICLLAAIGVMFFVDRVLLRDVPGADRPVLLEMLGILAYAGLYPAALITLVGAISWLDRPKPPREK